MENKIYRVERIIDCNNWDTLVTRTYGKTYNIQQQDGCRESCNLYFSVPLKEPIVDYGKESIPVKINGNDMCVKFDVWLNTPAEYPTELSIFHHSLFWQRNFYPDYEILAHDLFKRGLLEEGEYTIRIDW